MHKRKGHLVRFAAEKRRTHRWGSVGEAGGENQKAGPQNFSHKKEGDGMGHELKMGVLGKAAVPKKTKTVTSQAGP